MRACLNPESGACLKAPDVPDLFQSQQGSHTKSLRQILKQNTYSH